MSKLPLNLIVFCTTMGHGGRHTYQEVIAKLFSNFDPNLFENKVLHLKSREQEKDIANEIKSFCSPLDIRVIESKEEIVHHSENHLTHSAGYFKDIYKAYSDLDLRKVKYSLWLEDDWLFKIKDTNLESAFRESIEFLDENPDQVCIRFNRAEKFSKPDGDFLVENENIFTQAINYSKWGPTFTFQPNISRTNEIYITWKMAQQYLDRLGNYHCELMSGDLLKNVTNSETPFSFYDPEKIYTEHIG